MFKIEENKIHLTRGDCCTISLNVEDYSFKVGDIVTFCLYNKRALNEQPVLKKSIKLEQDTDNVDIELTSLDTKIGEMKNTPVEYWYEIELNDKQTLIGYDEDGAKILILYPEGANENDNSSE